MKRAEHVWRTGATWALPLVAFTFLCGCQTFTPTAAGPSTDAKLGNDYRPEAAAITIGKPIARRSAAIPSGLSGQSVSSFRLAGAQAEGAQSALSNATDHDDKNAKIGDAEKSVGEQLEEWKPTDHVTRKDERALDQSFHLRGRVDIDTVIVTQSAKNKATIGDVENATGFRRARLGAQGTIGEQVEWVAEFDFNTGSVNFNDVYVGLNQLPLFQEVRVGNFREPYGLEAQTNSTALTFMERSSLDALNPARNLGVGTFRAREDLSATLAMGAFRDGSNSQGLDVSDVGDWAFTARRTRLLWYDEKGRRLVHLGAALSFRRPAMQMVTIRDQANVRLVGVQDTSVSPFASNIVIPSDYEQMQSLEWAIVLGPLSFQAEWSGAYVDQIGGGPVFLHGSYLFASYFLTGEHRQYDRRYGRFAPVHVLDPFLVLKGMRSAWGLGAWEIALRYSYTDYKNKNIPPAPNGVLVGDVISEATMGVNWYLNDHARVMFNYVYVVQNNPNVGPSAGHVFSLRFGLFW